MADDERPPPPPRAGGVALPPAPRPRANLSTGTGVFSPENIGNNNNQQHEQQQRQQVRQPSFAASAPPPSPRPQPPPPPQQQPRPRTLVAAAQPPPPSANSTTASLPTLLATHPNSIIVSKRQEGNPLLKYLTNVRWVWGSEALSADYFLGPDAAALYLSLRFHLLKPQYVHARMAALAAASGGGGGGGGGSGAGGTSCSAADNGPRLKILLTLVDVEDAEPALRDVNVAALRRGFALICAFSAPEAARYLELFRAFESKPADVIRGRAGEDYLSRLNAALTSVRGVNKTDVLALGAAFGTAAGVLRAPRQALAAVPGVGPTKARRLADAFHEPFFKTYNSSAAATTTTQKKKQRTQAKLVVGGGGGGGSGPSLRVAAAPAPSAAAAAAALPEKGPREQEERRGGGGGGEGQGDGKPNGEDDEDDVFALEEGSAGPSGGAGAAELEVEEIEEDDDDNVGLAVDE